MLLSLVPEIQGRSDAGVSHTRTGHARPTTAMAAPARPSWRNAAGRPPGATHSHVAAMAGTTISAAPILASNPSPTQTPDSTSHRVRPSSNARTRHHTAAVTHSTSNASGLLCLETATAVGVSASASPAPKPAARPKLRRVMSYTSATLATPISACGTSMLHEP
jgi:hypothetical protein